MAQSNPRGGGGSDGCARAADRRNGPGRCVAPLSSKETEDCHAGVRPGVLEDPEPRRETEHELYAAPRGPKPPSPGVPSLATPLLAGQETEVLDASTLAFLTRAVLEKKKKKAEVEKEERMRRQRRQAEEHEERMLALNRRVRDRLARSLQPSTRLGRSGPVAVRPLPGRGGRGKRGGRKSFLGVLFLDTAVDVPAHSAFVHPLPVQLLDKVLDVPVVVLRLVPGLMVQKTVVRPQLQSIYGRRHSLSFSRGSSPLSRLFTRLQRFSSCCSTSGGRCPCCAGRAASPVLPWRRSLALPQLQLVEKSSPVFSRLQKTADFLQLQFINIVVVIPFVPQTQILMVQSIQQTTEFPQLLYVSGGRCPCCVGRA